jgi:hypothetical protein
MRNNQVDQTLAIMLRAITDLTDRQQELATELDRLKTKRKQKQLNGR